MIDLHSHVLPGLDDGARSLDEALEILRDMRQDGVATVVATPHVRHDYPTTVEQMLAALAQLRRGAKREGIQIEVLSGGELGLDVLNDRGLSRVAGFGLGGREELLLLEFPDEGWPYLLESRLADLVQRGVRPILAHPERNDRVLDEPGRLAAAVDAGAIVQLTAASVDGRLGRRTARCGEELLRAGLAHTLASDAHTPGVRAAGLSAAVQALGDARLGVWLTDEVPRALLAGHELPPRPRTGSRRRRRRWWWRR